MKVDAEKVDAEVVEPPTTKSVEGVAVVPEENLEVAMHTPSPCDVSVASVDLTEGDVSPAKKKQRICDMERIITGEELTDETINRAQQLLKSKYQQFNGFQSILLQGRKMAPKYVTRCK